MIIVEMENLDQDDRRRQKFQKIDLLTREAVQSLSKARLI